MIRPHTLGRCASIAVAIWANMACASVTVPSFAYIEGASPAGVATDAHGNIVVAGSTTSAGLPVSPGALQTTPGGAHDAFIAKLAPDGTILWCTYFGGNADDLANAIAVDPTGNVLVTGSTQSTNLPLLNAFQSTLNGNFNAFVLKLSPSGQMIYSTYLGGTGDIQAYGIAADSAGNAYLTGSTTTEDFPGQPPGIPGPNFVAKFDAAGNFVYSFIYSRNVSTRAIAVDASGSAYVAGEPASSLSSVPNLRLAFVFKLSPDGTHLLYESFFGGSQNNDETAIAVDANGAAYIAGTTDSADFPLVASLQPSLKARPLWKSTDSGSTWVPIDNLPFAYLQNLVSDPITAGTLYAGASDLGVFRSADNGATWTRMVNGMTYPEIYSLAVDPVNPAVMYSGGGFEPNYADGGWIYQTTDGGANWSLVDAPHYLVSQLAIDPLLPPKVYAISNQAVFETTNAGASWNAVATPAIYNIQSIAVDPYVEGRIYATSQGGEFYGGFPTGGFSQPAQVFESANSGSSWQTLQNVTPAAPGLVIDPSTKPATVYAGSAARSQDGGNTWTALTPPFGTSTVTALAADPSTGTLYAAAQVAANDLVFSNDRGQTWTPTGWPYANSTITGITPTSGALFATVQNTQTSAFVVKLSPDGSTIEFSTLLSGHPALTTVSANECGPALPLQCGDPALFASQNYATGIALDRQGDIVVAGGTRSLDFPVANPVQTANAGEADAFVAVISPSGSLKSSTYLGGSKNDGANGVAVDAQGNIIVAGLTDSPNFLGGTVSQNGSGSAFVGRVISGPPMIANVLNGASFQPGIEAGSWVMIQGTNLAVDSRLWQASDFADGNLPTDLDGTSVTIDGVPAYVEYISPTQINVLAPADSKVGMVNVAVINNGSVSAPATAQLQSVAPAFFMSPSYNVYASVIPGYIPVTANAPAMPGDLVVLWCTGLGPTNPPSPVGTIVVGAPATATLPVVTVGGMQVPVISSVLTTGTVGLYQITIQLPANVPKGTPAVQASISGAETQSGVTLFVGQQ